MSMITSLADAERVFGALTYNDLEAVKKNGGNRPDYTDGDGFVRWAGVSYEIEEEEETYPCACCDKEMALHEVNEGCDGWVCDACVEELSSDAEEEEDIDICGETGGLIKGFKGCGDKFDTQDTNMLGNTSFCVECYNKHEDTYYKEEDIGLCGSCKIQLDHLRDGSEEDGDRCHNCYWTEEGLDKGVELITPDYRKQNTI